MRRLLVFVAICASGCTASGSDAESHGPVFTGGDASVSDGSTTSDAPHGNDATAGNDATTGDDASTGDDGATGDDSSTILDATNDDVIDAGSCTALTAVVGATSSALFGAVAIGTGAFSQQTIAGTSGTQVSVAAIGAGFQLTFGESSNHALASSAYTTSWSTIATIGSATALDRPALAIANGALQLVTLDSSNQYDHGTFATSWDSANDPVGHVADGGTHAFGPTGASAAGVGTELVLAYEGNDSHLYAQSWTAAAGWADGAEIGTVTLYPNTSPAIVALDSGANDLLAVYVDNATTKINSFSRASSNKAWAGTSVLVDATAFTHARVALAPMSGGRAILVYKGTDGKAYSSMYASGAWSTPAPLVAAANPAVDAVPSVATGVCGDDAVATYVSGGAVSVVRLVSGTWQSPAAVSGVSGATSSAITTKP